MRPTPHSPPATRGEKENGSPVPRRVRAGNYAVFTRRHSSFERRTQSSMASPPK